jgi:hypothetical protein
LASAFADEIYQAIGAERDPFALRLLERSEIEPARLRILSGQQFRSGVKDHLGVGPQGDPVPV